MSSNLFPYKFSMEEWYKADFINESDVVVIVDTSREMIWFYRGKKSTARNRSNARELLNDLMKNYPSYSLKNISDETPDDVLILLEDLKEQFYKRRLSSLSFDLRKVSFTFIILCLVACFLFVLLITFSILFIIGSNTTIFEGYIHFTIPQTNFSFDMLLISSLFLVSFICFIITFLIAFFLRKSILILYSLVAFILSFLGFFIIRIWDFILFFEISGQMILFRVDVFMMFVINVNIIGLISLVFSIYLIIIGPKRILELR